MTKRVRCEPQAGGDGATQPAGGRRWAALLLIACAVLAPGSRAVAQATQPRLVVFEGFYNPG